MKKPRNFKEAALKSLEEKWDLTRRADTYTELWLMLNCGNCALCVLQKKRHPIGRNCGKCPLHDVGYDRFSCCRDYQIVTGGRSFPKTQSAVNRICKRLEKEAGI